MCVYLYRSWVDLILLPALISVCLLSIYIYLSISTCIYLSISIYLHVYLSIYIYLPISIYLYLPISIYLYLSISIYLYLSIYIYLYLAIPISIYLYLSISSYTYIYLPVSIYLYLSIYIYLSISIYLYLSIFIYYFRHANGSIKFWDVTSPAMVLLLDLKTAPIFSNPDSNEGDLDMFSEFTWPPYRKVSSYDPFDDDTRLSIKFIEFCPHSRKLCAGGEGGQVLTFALNTMPADVRVAVSYNSICDM